MNSKYAPLESHLRDSGRGQVPMTFREIEHVIGARLPPAAFRHRALWSNNPDNWVMTKAWLAAGYKTMNVDMELGKLVFLKVAPGVPAAGRGIVQWRTKRLLRAHLRDAEGHRNDLAGYGSDGPDRRRLERSAVTAQ